MILALAIAAVALYQTFSPKDCGSFECYKDRMKRCVPTKYVNEGDDATWLYHIRGIDIDKCAVDVTLLNAKNGDLGLRELEGEFMTCFYDKGVVAYPERNVGTCHGFLKEELQAVIIERLYDYVVLNLGDVREELAFS